jgi:hypothetical protein
LQASFPTLQLGEYLTYAPSMGGTLQRPMLRGVPTQDANGIGEYLSGLSGVHDQNADGSYSGDYNDDGIDGF